MNVSANAYISDPTSHLWSHFPYSTLFDITDNVYKPPDFLYNVILGLLSNIVQGRQHYPNVSFAALVPLQ